MSEEVYEANVLLSQDADIEALPQEELSSKLRPTLQKVKEINSVVEFRVATSNKYESLSTENDANFEEIEYRDQKMRGKPTLRKKQKVKSQETGFLSFQRMGY